MRKPQNSKSLSLQIFSAVCLSLTLLSSFLISTQADAGFINLLRKATKHADGDGVSINPKLDLSDLKAIKVKPGTTRAKLLTRQDGSLLIIAEGGQELVLASNMDIATTLKQFSRSLKTADGSKVTKLKIFVKQQDLFANSSAQPLLRQVQKLHIVTTKGKNFPLFALKDNAQKNIWGMGVRKNLVVLASDGTQMNEALWRMQKTFNRADVHLISFDGKAPTKPDTLPKRLEGALLPTPVNPEHLKKSIAALHGKKLIVTGQVNGNQLMVKSAGGSEHIIQLNELKALATSGDIDLFIVGKKSAAQPSKVGLFNSSLTNRMKKAFQAHNYGDFLQAIHGQKEKLLLDTEISSANRVTFHSLSRDTANQPSMLSKILKDIDPVGTVVSGASKKLVEGSLELYSKSKELEQELDSRIVPGIPSTLQFVYIANIVLGLIGWTVSRWLWQKIWPKPEQEQFRSTMTFIAMRTLRFFVFVFGFLGMVGSLMALLFAIKQVWDWVKLIWLIVTWPLRMILRIFTPSKATEQSFN